MKAHNGFSLIEMLAATVLLGVLITAVLAPLARLFENTGDSGQTLRVTATDQGSLKDFQAFARQTGNELIDQQTQGKEFIHVLRRR